MLYKLLPIHLLTPPLGANTQQDTYVVGGKSGQVNLSKAESWTCTLSVYKTSGNVVFSLDQEGFVLVFLT